VIKDEDKIKLTDFNISKLCKSKAMSMMTHTGTEAFSAPEMHTS
jgi:serine/threonine protein kinase